ncbi:hypothetical protein WJX74_003431 [Apatococcus lobatus]|uniref:Uncharacterized protein n=1 Tax=Apatococcus lobatus TaxID=904363 RepID=A0AAW1QCR8_9CHLO
MSDSDSHPGDGGVKEDSGSDSVPSWIQNYKPKDQGVTLPLDLSSDSEVEQITQPSQLPTQASATPTFDKALGKDSEQAPGPSQPALQAADGSTAADAASQEAAAGKGPARLPSGITTAGGKGPAPKELPLNWAEKAGGTRYLVEVDTVAAGPAADLTGDAGAVGRVNVVGPKGQLRMVIDLKGLPCNGTLHPSAGTFCIANIGQEEAKLEAVMTSFISLCPDAAAAAELRSHDAQALFRDEDDDNFNDQDPGASGLLSQDVKGKGKGKRSAKAMEEGGSTQPAAKKARHAAGSSSRGSRGRGKGGKPRKAGTSRKGSTK